MKRKLSPDELKYGMPMPIIQTGEASQTGSAIPTPTRETYPYHFRVADHYAGIVEPFEYFHGPYVSIPDRGRLHLMSHDGITLNWYDETNNQISAAFVVDADNDTALARAITLIEHGGETLRERPVIARRINPARTFEPFETPSRTAEMC